MDLEMLTQLGGLIPVVSDVIGMVGNLLTNNQETAAQAVTAVAGLGTLAGVWKSISALIDSYTGKDFEKSEKKGVLRAEKLIKWEQNINNLWEKSWLFKNTENKILKFLVVNISKKIIDISYTRLDGYTTGISKTLHREES